METESQKTLIDSTISGEVNNEISIIENERELVQDSAPISRKSQPTVRHRPGDSSRLRHRIVAVDVTSSVFAWTITFFSFNALNFVVPNVVHLAVGQLSFSAICFTLCIFFSLYRTRISHRASAERFRILGVSIIAGALAGVIQSVWSSKYSVLFSITAGVSFFIFDTFLRSLFRQWLRIQRSRGRYQREILLVGTNSDAQAMYDLLRTHPEVGFTIVGVVGDKDEANKFDDIAWCGNTDEVVQSARKTGATGVVIASNALEPFQLRKVTNALLARSIHVHVSSGLFGFDERRLRPQSFSREPVFYVEPISFPLFQRIVKRTFDIIVSSILLVFASPIIAISAILIKLGDKGPVFFHQTRIGKDMHPFRCIKLRTMRVDAEKNLKDLMDKNERHGPLFKHSSDPRRTNIGKFLEAASLDELPQLWLVLTGTMSLIGPRPALPHEVAVFDDDLNQRHLVRPGITGLWQVESRDNPSFDAYKRLDIFYVENWSLLLDLSVMALTLHVVMSRALRKIFMRQNKK
ncbi:MAG: sugar transferase [Acidimicrobiia bacterium]